MWIPMPQGEFKSSEERVVTARAPEALELYKLVLRYVRRLGPRSGQLVHAPVQPAQTGLSRRQRADR